MAEAAWKIGDVVVLNGGGQAMTVESEADAPGDNGTIGVVWFHDSELRRGRVRSALVRRAGLRDLDWRGK